MRCRARDPRRPPRPHRDRPAEHVDQRLDRRLPRPERLPRRAARERQLGEQRAAGARRPSTRRSPTRSRRAIRRRPRRRSSARSPRSSAEVPVVPLYVSTDWALSREGLLGAGGNGMGILRMAGMAWAPMSARRARARGRALLVAVARRAWRGAWPGRPPDTDVRRGDGDRDVRRVASTSSSRRRSRATPRASRGGRPCRRGAAERSSPRSRRPRPGATTLRYTYETPFGSLYPNTRVELGFRVTFDDGRVDRQPDDDDPLRGRPVRVADARGRARARPLGRGRRRVRAAGARRSASGRSRRPATLLGVDETEPIDFFVYGDRDAFFDVLGPAIQENVGGVALAGDPDAVREHRAVAGQRPLGGHRDPARADPPRLRHRDAQPVPRAAALAERGPRRLPRAGLQRRRPRRGRECRPIRCDHAAARPRRPLPDRRPTGSASRTTRACRRSTSSSARTARTRWSASSGATPTGSATTTPSSDALGVNVAGFEAALAGRPRDRRAARVRPATRPARSVAAGLERRRPADAAPGLVVPAARVAAPGPARPTSSPSRS